MNKKITISALAILSILFVTTYIIAGERVAVSPQRLSIDNNAVSSLKFDGTGDKIVVTNSTSIDLTNPEATIEALFKIDRTGNTDTIVGKSDGGITTGYRVRVSTNGVITAFISDDGSQLRVDTGEKIYPNRWYHVVIVVGTTDIRAYINGSLDTNDIQAKSGSITSDSGNLEIGDDNSAGHPMEGLIKKVRIWDNVALTASQVSNLYYSNVVPREGIVGEWLLNEATGTTAYDTSGNSNDGTITGATWSTDVPSKARATSTTRQVVVDDKASLLFNGASDYIIVGDKSELDFGTGNFTIQSKVKVRAEADYKDICSKYGGGFAFQIDQTTDKLIMNEKGVVFDTPNEITLNEWLDIVYTRDGSVRTFYVDGVVFYTETDATIPDMVAGDNFTIGALTGGSQAFNGWMKNLRVYNVALSADQVSKLYYNNIVPQPGLVGEWLMNEGAGVTVVDTSSSGNDGTVTNSTWSSDTPSQKRKVVNGNLVENGDFEFAPPFVAVQTSDGWIDGTASGGGAGANINPIKWYLNLNGTSDVQFATSTTYSGDYSLRLSTRDTNTAFIEVHYNDTGHYSSGLVVEPSTSYTLTHWMKTDYVSGDSGDGALIAVPQGDGQGTGVTTSNSTKVKTTTGWTKYTTVFTTNSATREVNIEPRIYGHTGTATLIMDAYFDDIVLKKTSDL